jgi:hypothetical protein
MLGRLTGLHLGLCLAAGVLVLVMLVLMAVVMRFSAVFVPMVMFVMMFMTMRTVVFMGMFVMVMGIFVRMVMLVLVAHRGFSSRLFPIKPDQGHFDNLGKCCAKVCQPAWGCSTPI